MNQITKDELYTYLIDVLGYSTEDVEEEIIHHTIMETWESLTNDQQQECIKYSL